MTSERLDTLRFIAHLRTITISDLALNQRITYGAALRRLHRAKKDGLARSDVDTSVQVKPGHGSPQLVWSLTKKGIDRLAYFEEHLREPPDAFD